MNKQTKQAVILGVLLVVLGGVALWVLVFNKDEAKPAPQPDPAAQNPPAAPPAAPGQPQPQPQPGQPGQPAAAAGPEQPLPLPAELEKNESGDTKYGDMSFRWKIGPEVLMAYDPLHVQDLEVVEPGRRKYIEDFRNAWIIEGVTEFFQLVKVLDEDKNPKKDEHGKDMMEWKLVREVWFKGKIRPYREDDRLTLTRFTIKKIVRNALETSVEIEGDNGEKLKLQLAKPDRYGVFR